MRFDFGRGFVRTCLRTEVAVARKTGHPHHHSRSQAPVLAVGVRAEVLGLLPESFDCWYLASFLGGKP